MESAIAPKHASGFEVDKASGSLGALAPNPELLAQLAKHPTNADAQQILSKMASSPGFASLSAGEQTRLFKLVGGNE